jgi:4-hydroxy-tetrahydrodipicolinate reductase
MSVRVCVAGATGWVGKPLCFAISQAEDLELVGAVSRSHQGQPLKDALGDLDSDVTVSGSVAEALATPTDVLVDYTRADVVKANVLTAVAKGVHVVIGSSGLTDADYTEIHRAALDNHVGVISAGNFAITAVLLQRFACEAAKYLSHWEVIDYASNDKVDAPSGTARELASRLSEIRKPEITHPVDEIIGERESRGASLNGTPVHSLRLPGYVIGVQVVFGAMGERLTLVQDAGAGAEPYIQGTLLAVRQVKNYAGLVRGLDRIME